MIPYISAQDFMRKHGDALCKMLNIDPRGIRWLTIYIPEEGVVEIALERIVTEPSEDVRE